MADNTTEEGERENAVPAQEEDDDEALVIYDEGDIAEGIKGCQNSLLGKLIIDKTFNLAWVQSAMLNIWRKPKGFREVEIKPKLYQFFFSKGIIHE